MTRKLACDNAKEFSCEGCQKQFTRNDSLMRHQEKCKKVKDPVVILQQQLEEVKLKLHEMSQQIPRATEATLVVNAPVTNINNVNHVNVEITPWGSPLALSDADVEAALARLPCLAGTPALGEIVNTLMELVKRAHEPVSARNIHLNPKRADQALALTEAGWAALPLGEATAVLFDQASARIAVRPAMVPQATMQSMLRTVVPTPYRVEKESAVQLGLRPMEAHLLNTRPGGPGPLRLAGPLVKTVATATVARKPPTQSDRLIKALAQYPLRCEPSGAVSVGWIVAAMQAAGLSGPELFAALKAHGGPAWAAAELYTAEKTQMHKPPKTL